MSLLSSLGYVTGPFGAMAAIAINVLGTMLTDDDIPMIEGQAQAVWDEAGHVRVNTTQDTGGGATATGWMTQITTALQAHVAQTVGADGQPAIGLLPQRLPTIGFQYDADGYNYNGVSGHLYLKWIDADGQEQTRYYDGNGGRSDGTGATLGSDFMRMAMQAVVPAWEADTVLAHWQETRASQGLDAANEEARRMPAGTLPEEAPDHLTQVFSALTLTQGPLSGDAAAGPRRALVDIDHDGFLEATGWLAANQAVLAIDVNGDGQFGAPEFLHANGPANARTNAAWLDVDHNGFLDAHDPAFAAIRLWLDVNGNGRTDAGEAQSLAQAGIVALDFTQNPPRILRADGSSTALTVQQLTGEVEGVALQEVDGGLLEITEDGDRQLHATNSRQFDGQAGHVHGGEATVPPTTPLDVEVGAGDTRLVSTGSRTARSDVVQQDVVVTAASGATATSTSTSTSTSASATATATATLTTSAGQGTVLAGQAPGQTQGAVIDERSAGLRGDPAPVVMVPAGATTANAAFRNATAAMVRSAYGGQGSSPHGGLNDPLVIAAIGMGAVQWPVVSSAGQTADAAQMAGGTTASAAWNPNPPNNLAPPGSVAPDAPAQPTYLFRTTDGRVDPMSPSAPDWIAPASAQPHTVPGLAAAQSGGAPAPHEPVSSSPTSLPTSSPSTSSALSPGVWPGTGPAAPSPSADIQPADAPGNPAFSTPSLVLDYPHLQGEHLAGTEDNALRIPAALLLANDRTANGAASDVATLRLTSVGNPQHGRVALVTDAAGEAYVLFLSDADYHGPARFDYTVSDAYGLAATTTATLDIAAVNDAPVVTGEAASGDEDHTLAFTAVSLLANDSDPDTPTDADLLRITRVGAAVHGTVLLDADGTVRFIPEPDYNGPASFRYWVGDRSPEAIARGDGAETEGEVLLTILPVNDLPVVRGESLASDEDVVLRIAPALLLANDSDVDTDPATAHGQAPQVLAITAVGNARHGRVQLLADGQIEFTPEADYAGAAGFDYTVDDGHGGRVQATATLTLAPVNDAPVVTGDPRARPRHRLGPGRRHRADHRHRRQRPPARPRLGQCLHPRHRPAQPHPRPGRLPVRPPGRGRPRLRPVPARRLAVLQPHGRPLCRRRRLRAARGQQRRTGRGLHRRHHPRPAQPRLPARPAAHRRRPRRRRRATAGLAGFAHGRRPGRR